MALFFTGDGESATTIICALELPDNDWFKRALIEALTLMCDQNNWSERGTATADFARDKSCEMNETLLMDVFIPTIPIGTMQMFPGNSIPDKWMRCEGQSLLRSDYAELFALIGTNYGFVDSTHFNLPDMRNRSPYGVGSQLPSVGDTTGSAAITLAEGQLPAHHHGQNVNAAPAYVGGAAGAAFKYSAAAATATTRANTDDTGSGSPVTVMHPVRAVYYLIYTGV